MTLNKHIVVLVGLVILATACAPRGTISMISERFDQATVQRIYVATTREPTQSQYDFSNSRSRDIRYNRFDISIPPNHQLGQIEWPKKRPNPATDFVTLDHKVFSDAQTFRRDANAQSGQQTKEAVVFVHGYNNTFAEGLYRFAQMAVDLNIEGIKYHYAWPSAASARAYVQDRDSVLFARDGLEQLLREVAKSDAKGIFIVAHSIGAALTVETLRQIAIADDVTLGGKLRGVALISPDIDATVFATQLERIKPLPNPFLIFASRKDLALRISSLLTGNRDRVGMLDNLELLSKYKVNIIDITKIDDDQDPLNHSVVSTSPTMLKLLGNSERLRDLFNPTKEARKGSNPVSLIIQTANDATQTIINPRP